MFTYSVLSHFTIFIHFQKCHFQIWLGKCKIKAHFWNFHWNKQLGPLLVNIWYCNFQNAIIWFYISIVEITRFCAKSGISEYWTKGNIDQKRISSAGLAGRCLASRWYSLLFNIHLFSIFTYTWFGTLFPNRKGKGNKEEELDNKEKFVNSSNVENFVDYVQWRIPFSSLSLPCSVVSDVNRITEIL